DVRVDAHEVAVMIGVAVAGPCGARLDVAHHRTGIATDLVATRGDRRISHHLQALQVSIDSSRANRQQSTLVVRPDRSCANDLAREAGPCQAPQLPNISPACLARCPQSGHRVAVRHAALARLYTNGSLSRSIAQQPSGRDRDDAKYDPPDREWQDP